MQSLDQISNALLSMDARQYPPVHTWNPPYTGNLDIVIKSNGDWYHDGVKFTRQSLVKLFSSILKKEGDDYFLVTPVEKWKITVEDAPLLIVDMEIIKNSLSDEEQVIRFTTTTDDIVFLGPTHPLRIFGEGKNIELRPYVLVRNNLDALVHRNVFYQMANLSVIHEGRGGVWSGGKFFALE